MTIDIGILLKNHVRCSFMLKYDITVLLRQFTKCLNQFFELIWDKQKFENWYACFI